MALVDVTQPVVIRPTLQISRASRDFLRRVCFVSLGETNLLAGESLEVYNYNYKNYLNGYTETTNALRGFFSQASDKSCFLLELGKQEGTPLANSYANKVKFLNTLHWFDIVDFYDWVYYNKWLKNTANETKTIIVNYYNTISVFSNANYTEWLQLNRLTDTVENLKEYLNQLNSSWFQKYPSYLATSVNTFRTLLTDAILIEWLNSLPAGRWSIEAYDIWRDENGTKNTNYSKKIASLEKFLTTTVEASYIYYLPQQMLADARISSRIYQKYVDLQSRTYFFINCPGNANINSNQIINNAKNFKCVAVFYDNSKDDYNLAATVAGLFASYKFDISDTRPASPFNYKTLEGIQYNNLTQSTQQSLIQASLNFMSTLANNDVLLNGRYSDSYPIDYRYQWDLVSFEVETALQTLILNGVNNPTYIVKYNQDGIDTIRSNIKATLNKMISQGCVTDFSARLNSATGAMEGLGDITAIDFHTYITANPKDYENEIYGGVSFYLRIGRYIRQVVLSITLG